MRFSSSRILLTSTMALATLNSALVRSAESCWNLLSLYLVLGMARLIWRTRPSTTELLSILKASAASSPTNDHLLTKLFVLFPQLQTSGHGDKAKSLAPQPVEDNRRIQNFSKVAEEHRQVVLSESEGDVADVESGRRGVEGLLRYDGPTTATCLDLVISKLSFSAHLGCVGWSWLGLRWYCGVSWWLQNFSVTELPVCLAYNSIQVRIECRQ